MFGDGSKRRPVIEGFPVWEERKRWVKGDAQKRVPEEKVRSIVGFLEVGIDGGWGEISWE